MFKLKHISCTFARTVPKFQFSVCNTLHMQLSEEGGNYLSVDLPSHLI
jgi:hypothetical protein